MGDNPQPERCPTCGQRKRVSTDLLKWALLGGAAVNKVGFLFGPKE